MNIHTNVLGNHPVVIDISPEVPKDFQRKNPIDLTFLLTPPAGLTFNPSHTLIYFHLNA